MNSSSVQHYTALAKFFHWLIAGGIALQYVLANLAEAAEETGRRVDQLGLLANHKSVGMTVLMLAFARVAWRAANRAPALPLHMPSWQKLGSHCSHIALYLLMFLVPLTGWLMSSASAYSVSWFNLFQFPDLISGDPDLKHRLESIHETLAKLLFVVVVLHVAAAFKHAFFDRDGVMSRMSSVPAVGMFVITLGAGLALLTRTGPAEADAGRAADASEPAASAPAEALPTSSLPTWNIDAANSHIEFSGDQAGAAFTGRWPGFQATLQFDADRLGESRFHVTVDTTSPDTGDEERDTTMVDAEWFDANQFPEAVYQTGQFEATDAGFVANGPLLIKRKSRATPLNFTVTADGDRRVLDGTATIDRLAFDLGTGDWSDTTWVGQTVEVRVHIEATVNP
ncbi:MAG: cytochrome b/b6 domain-containing protein [Pseudomonadota bacterium]